MKKKKEEIKEQYPPCQYNSAVRCDPQTRRCQTCGWNPVVAQERLDKLTHNTH